jgi:hypothetical protein
MIRTTTFAALLLAGVSFPAMATRQEPPRQTGGATSAQASAQASSVAGAAASNRTSVRTTATGGRATSSAAGGNASAAGTQTVNVTQGGASSGGTQTIRSAPDVTAPAIWSNNPCVVSASGGVTGLGWGVAIGAGIEDPDCTRRANAQHLAAMGEREAAREVLCGSREVREAFARIGRPCAADAVRVQSVAVQPRAVPVERPAPANTSGLSDGACATLRQRGMAVQGCP